MRRAKPERALEGAFAERVAVRPGEIKALVEWDGRDWFILAQATGSDAEALTEHERADATEQART